MVIEVSRNRRSHVHGGKQAFDFQGGQAAHAVDALSLMKRLAPERGDRVYSIGGKAWRKPAETSSLVGL